MLIAVETAKTSVGSGIAKKVAAMVISHTLRTESAVANLTISYAHPNSEAAVLSMAGKLRVTERPNADLS